MANIRPRKNKTGEVISYEIRVHKGYDTSGKQLQPYVMTYKPAPGMTSKQIERELNKQAVQFEESCKQGYSLNNRQTFAQYAEYVILLKERTGIKHSVIKRYRDMLPRINAGIGHIKLSDLRPAHLNNLYEQLSQNGIRANNKKAVCKVDLKQLLKEKCISKEELSKQSDISLYVISSCYRKDNVSYNSAESIANALNMSVNSLFTVIVDDTPLSSKTVVEHHRLISTILAQAEKEMLIPYNPARKSTPPKADKSKPNYFQPEDVEAIRDCLEQVELKWKVVVHLLLISGARRGEIAGLKWSAVDFKNSQIHINNNLLYSADWGIYQDTTKTEESDRFVKLPAETMELLKEYRQWWITFRNECGSAWNSFVEIADNNGIKHSEKNDFLFVKDRENVGYPTHPDTITAWCNDFSEKYKLPHINPHAFRHTHASILYFAGVDSISISKRLGHAKVSTTTDIYSHIIKQADEAAAECIATAVFGKKKA